MFVPPVVEAFGPHPVQQQPNKWADGDVSGITLSEPPNKLIWAEQTESEAEKDAAQHAQWFIEILFVRY